MSEEPLSWQQRLRQWRKSSGLTQADAAEELAKVAWLRHGERVGVNPDMISKWERGLKQPSRRYRDLILVLASESQVDSLPSPPGDQVAIVPIMVPDGEDVDRREFLATGLLGAADLALLGNAPGWPVHLEPSDAGVVVSSIRRATSAHRQLDATVPSRHLTTPVLSHLRFAAGISGSVATPEGQRVASAAMSEIAGLAAWLHWDLLDVIAARRYYSVAIRAADAAHQPMLAAYMLGSLAQLTWEHGDALGAERLLARARRTLSGASAPTAFAWLSALEARTRAAVGDRISANRSLAIAHDAAEEAVATASAPWPWMSAFSPAKVAAHRAACAMVLQEVEVVHEAVEMALSDGLGDKQRALLELTRAEAALGSGDVELAFRLAGRSLDIGLALSSVRVVEGARQLRRNHRGRVVPAVRRFDERLRAWPGEWV